MVNYWFTADTHFSHHNIMRYQNRPFDNIDDMDEAMIENWNKAVKPNDFIYHLGDFGFGDCLSIFRRLSGRKYFIKGNHDRNPTLKFDWVWVKDVAMINVKGVYIWLSHYAHRSWNRSFHGAWHFFGHTHRKLDSYGASEDVGVDGHGFAPWNFDELAPIMEKRQLDWSTNRGPVL